MTITLDVNERDGSVSPKKLRANGDIPAVVYGYSQTPIPITIEAKKFIKVFDEAGESNIIELKGLKSKMEVLIKDVEFSPVKQDVVHADLYVIEQGKAMTAYIPLHFIGESPAEDKNIGVVNKLVHEVEVECKPADLPSYIEVDISSLETLEDKILMGDIKLPKGVEITHEADEPVVILTEAKEEEPEEPEVEPDIDSIEVEQKGKTEEEAE